MGGTLGEHIVERDRALFVGRQTELEAIAAALADHSVTPVVLLHGPGGIGKSAIVREASRRASASGASVVTIDAWTIDSMPESFDEALAEARPGRRLVVVLDGLESMSEVGAHLRRHVLPHLPSEARVLVAAREAPDEGWRADGWDASIRVISIGALDPSEASELLERRHVAGSTVDDIVRWADGLPLALAVAAEAALSEPGFEVLEGALDVKLARLLVRALGVDRAGGWQREVLGLAAVHGHLDERLVAAVLPHADAAAALRWLGGVAAVEDRGHAVRLHERVRTSLRAVLVEDDPELDRALRRRATDHLCDRAVLGEPLLLAEVGQLVDDPTLRWGLAGDRSLVRSDRVRPGDLDALGAQTVHLSRSLVDTVRRWVVEAPEHVVVLRHADDLVGVACLCSPEWMPLFAADDPVLRTWSIDPTLAEPPDATTLFPYGLVLAEGELASAVISAGNVAAYQRLGQPNPRRFCLGVDPSSPLVVDFLHTFGYEHRHDLAVDLGDATLETFVLDHGPGGLISTMRSVVYADLGLAVPSAADRDLGVVDHIRPALRSYHDPATLAASPLAIGATPHERAESVRWMIAGAMDRAFGSDESGRRSRALVEAAYLDPDGTHERAALAFHMSRATYFRQLADAVARLADALGGSPH